MTGNDSNNDPIVIVGAKRTPMGGFQGDFANVTAAELGAASIAGAISDAGIADEDVEEVIMGCVCLLYTSPSPRDISGSRMPSSA